MNHRGEKNSGSSLLGYFVRHRTAANLLLLAMVVAGVVASTQIRAQFFPDVTVDKISVSVAWSGVGPKEMDDAIVARIEPQMRTVEGVKTVTALARQGAATVTLEFQPGWDTSRGLDDVKAALDEIRDLPDDAELPVVRPARWRDRVTDVMITGPVDIELLNRYAESFKTELFRRGVTLVEIEGVSPPEYRIDVKPAAIERYQITLSEISAAIAAETGTKPVGRLEKSGSRVTAQSRALSVETLGSLPVRSLTDGSKLRLRDVASITEEGLDRTQALYNDGKPAVLIAINRDANGDALELQAIVEKLVASVAPGYTQGVSISLVNPRAKAISDRLDILVRNGLTGLVIVVVLLFLFLSARTAFWVSAGIPVAMAATVAMMYAFGLTFNMVSLFALIICLGIVVDDAIVVGEHADHLARKGLSAAEAATSAARRMAAPVFSASITTVIAFSVLGVIGGRFGRLISDMPFTVAVVILASLIESFLILPAHMRHALLHAGRRSVLDIPSIYVNRGLDWFKETIFRRTVRTVLRLRYPTIAVGVLLLSISASAYFDGTVRWRFFNAPERSTIRANLAMLDSASRANTREAVRELDRALKVVNARYTETYGTAPVKVAVAKVGGTTGRGLKGADTKETDLLAGYNIELIDPDLRSYSARQFIRDWRDEIKTHPQLEVLALRGDRSGPGGDDINVSLSGGDETTLKAAAEEIKTALARYAAASGVEDNLSYDRPEQVVALTPRGEALGFTTAGVASALRQRINGIEAVKIARNSQEVIARVRLPKDDLGTAYLHQAKLPVPSGGFASLSEIATITEVQGFSSIRRENGERSVTVTGDLSDDTVASAEVMNALVDAILPSVAERFGVEWSLGGLAEQEREFLSEAMLGMSLALIGIYLILAWVFASWTRPVIVMLVIPFGVIGMIWGHYLHGVPITMFSIVGLMGMAGILINDSIVLVTTVDERAERSGTFDAIVDGTVDRLRAVLLTTLTTVGGLAPLLLETSRQAQFLKPTVITLAYGLGFGVVLVLLLTPAMMAIQHDVGMNMKSLRRLPKLLRRRKALQAT